MKFDRFMIAPLGQGQVNNVRPWLIPDEAFYSMRNSYVYRQRVKKRFGSKWFGDLQSSTRLRQVLVPAALVVTTPQNIAVGQMFSIGTTYFTVVSTAFPDDLLTTGVVTAQITAANQVTFSAIADTVYWYPSLPVMGLLDYEQANINIENTIAFDTRYAYQYNSADAGWERISAGGAASIWSGTDSDFFWSTTWRGPNGNERYFFVTNNVNADGMRFYDGATWAAFAPATLAAANNSVVTARLIVVFKNRLLLFNTQELVGGNARTFGNRVRWSQIGDPTAADAFRTDIPGKGGAADAATSEAIVSCEFLRDRLIVYFERSTWELAFTNNQIYPFIWQKINTELGAESTFSIVPFDKVVLGIGNVGVHACNGSNVDRIDQKIPQEIYKIRDDGTGVFRVYGIRDYYSEMVYWTFPSADETDFPNRVLVYNYELGSWAFNDDTITCFGYFQPTNAVTWDSTTVTWDDAVSWDSGALQARFRQVVGGNQQGFTFIIDADSQVSKNSSNLQITGITTAGVVTIINHNFVQGQWVLLEQLATDFEDATTGMIQSITDEGVLIPQERLIYKIQSVTDANTFVLSLPTGYELSSVYRGGGVCASVSQVDLYTKQYNFYAKQGQNAYVQKVDFMVDRINGAQITVDYYASSSSQGLLLPGQLSGSLLGTGALDLGPYDLYPQEASQERIWHPVYMNAEGEVVQLRIYYNDEQMLDENSSLTPFEMHAMTLYATPTSRLQ